MTEPPTRADVLDFLKAALRGAMRPNAAATSYARLGYALTCWQAQQAIDDEMKRLDEAKCVSDAMRQFRERMRIDEAVGCDNPRCTGTLR